jgi:hypothetical protein
MKNRAYNCFSDFTTISADNLFITESVIDTENLERSY